MVKKIFLLPVLLFFVSLHLAITSAWDWDTHQYIAEKILIQYFPECKYEIDDGSIYPDKVLRDNIKHHCYTECPVLDEYYCPKKIDCPAKAEATKWIATAKIQAGCEKAFSLAVASHYISDIYVPMHNIVNEDYEKCHAIFERKIGEAIEKGSFPVKHCCEKPEQCFVFSEEDLDNVIFQTSDFIGYKSEAKKSNEVTGNLVFDGEFINIENVLLFLSMIIFLGLALIILFGRRRKHKF